MTGILLLLDIRDKYGELKIFILEKKYLTALITRRNVEREDEHVPFFAYNVQCEL